MGCLHRKMAQFAYSEHAMLWTMIPKRKHTNQSITTIDASSCIEPQTWTRFLYLSHSKRRLCPANHRPSYWSNLPCDWLSTVLAYSEQKTENGPWNQLRCRVASGHVLNSEYFVGLYHQQMIFGFYSGSWYPTNYHSPVATKTFHQRRDVDLVLCARVLPHACKILDIHKSLVC